METTVAIKSRRSIRKFKSDTIPDNMLIEIIEAGTYAPSAGNLQRWKFILIKNKNLIKEIQKAVPQRFLSEAPLVLIVYADIDKGRQRYGDRSELYAIQDTSAAIQNILLNIHSMGLGACWIGAFDMSIICKVIRSKPTEIPIAIIPIGYPNESPAIPERLPLYEVLTILG